MATYEVLDISGQAVERKGSIDIDRLTERLREIRDKIIGVVDEELTKTGLALDEVEVALTVEAEAGLAFITKGSAEASITLTFKRA
jgi:hypothetical protein